MKVLLRYPPLSFKDSNSSDGLGLAIGLALTHCK